MQRYFFYIAKENIIRLVFKNNVKAFSDGNKKSCHPKGKQLWKYSLQMSTC